MLVLVPILLLLLLKVSNSEISCPINVTTNKCNNKHIVIDYSSSINKTEDNVLKNISNTMTDQSSVEEKADVVEEISYSNVTVFENTCNGNKSNDPGIWTDFNKNDIDY